MEKVHDTIRFARNVLRKVNRDQVRAHSAEAAFFLMMCFFPLLMLLITMLKYTSVTPEEIIVMVEEITPFDVRDLLGPILDSIYNQTIALVSGTVIAAVWTAGKGVLGMADGLNTIYRIVEPGNYFVTRFRAAAYMVVLVIAIGVSAVIMVMGYGFSGFVSEKITLLSFLPDFSTIIPALIAMVVLTVLFLFMYSYLPNHRMRMSGQLPGAIFASVAWSIFSFIFSIYLDYSTNMSVIYGSLTTLVAIMLWLYVCMYLWFIGAEINHYLAAPELFSPDVPAPWGKKDAHLRN
ncbi:MAG: YihY/virulence factor BrkB family protein [Lachnospiraceae bacterium]|nr:YihY/virulence factor BrkB family protein [Lachnospiraceae bacterium]